MSDSEQVLPGLFEAMMQHECCASCRWFGPFDWSGGDGQCRRRSPVCSPVLTFPNYEPSDEDCSAVWPIVSFYDLCGEWNRALDHPGSNVPDSEERHDACIAFIQARHRAEDEYMAQQRAELHATSGGIPIMTDPEEENQ